jgi:hypothetical protein
MAYVKLDTGILQSTLWIDVPQSRVFLTALLLAEPKEFKEPVATFEINEMRKLKFVVPPGWYGFVAASAPGIIHHAQVGQDAGVRALQQLADPEALSRSSDFEGRRMVRIDGGFLILNYMKYRDKDHTAAARQRRLRDRKRNAVTPSPSRDIGATSRIADADADADADKTIKAEPQELIPADVHGLMAAVHVITRIQAYPYELPDSQALRIAIARSHEALVNGGKSPQAALEYLVAVTFDAIEGRTRIDKFFFEDAKWRGNANGHGTSAAAGRAQRSRDTITDTLRNRISQRTASDATQRESGTR